MPVPIDRDMVPEDADGIAENVNPVALVWTKPLAVPLVSDISPKVKPVPDSETSTSMITAHETVLGAVEESKMFGTMVSSVPVNTMPDATIWLVIPPE